MKNKNAYEILIPGGLFIGVGLGLLIEQVAAGTLLGLGIGFTFSFIYSK